jgi:transcriptional/translational regulatory protein YebC/TACO1
MFSKLSAKLPLRRRWAMPDPGHEPAPAFAVNAAKAQSMPKDNIQRAIDKATRASGDNYEEIRYEGLARAAFH